MLSMTAKVVAFPNDVIFSKMHTEIGEPPEGLLFDLNEETTGELVHIAMRYAGRAQGAALLLEDDPSCEPYIPEGHLDLIRSDYSKVVAQIESISQRLGMNPNTTTKHRLYTYSFYDGGYEGSMFELGTPTNPCPMAKHLYETVQVFDYVYKTLKTAIPVIEKLEAEEKSKTQTKLTGTDRAQYIRNITPETSDRQIKDSISSTTSIDTYLTQNTSSDARPDENTMYFNLSDLSFAGKTEQAAIAGGLLGSIKAYLELGRYDLYQIARATYVSKGLAAIHGADTQSLEIHGILSSGENRRVFDRNFREVYQSSLMDRDARSVHIIGAIQVAIEVAFGKAHYDLN